MWFRRPIYLAQSTQSVEQERRRIFRTWYQVKEFEGKGWGYAYLKQWLPDNFGIKCGKQAKQAAVFKSLADLRIIRVLSKGKKGRSTRWALGSRVLARLDGDDSQDEAVANTHNREDLTWMVEECWDWSPWDHLEEEGREENKGSTSLCSLNQ